MKEQWRPVKGFEGLYEVSDLGNVKRVSRILTDCLGKAKRVSEMPIKEDPELHRVILSKDGKYSDRYVRSLVAEAFMNIPYGTSLTHLDNDSGNSCLCNIVTTDQFRKMDPDWRDIPEWEGEYQASRFGEIRSLDRYVQTKSGTLRFVKGVVRSLEEDHDGYYQVGLYRQGKCVITTNAHIFVAKAWIPNPESKPTVNHIDGNKKNNCVENLEWATFEEQQEHAVRMGLRQRSYWNLDQSGPVGGNWNKSRQIKVRCIETQEEFESYSDASRAFNCSPSEIKLSVEEHRVCQGKHFVRADEVDYTFGVESLNDEIWKPIPEFEGLYEMSNFKRVKSLKRIVNTGRGQRTVPEKLLSVRDQLMLNRDGINTSISINELYSALFA